MAPTSPAVIFPNLEKYVQRSSSNADKVRKELPSGRSTKNLKRSKANGDEAKDKRTKGKIASTCQPVAFEHDDIFPPDQNTENGFYKYGIDHAGIDEESYEEADIPSVGSTTFPFGISGSLPGISMSGHEDLQPLQARTFEVASYNDKKTEDEVETVSERTKPFSHRPTATIRPKRQRKKPDMLKDLGWHSPDSPKVRKVSAPDGFDITEVHLTRRQTKMLDDISGPYEISPLEKLSPESSITSPSKHKSKGPKTLPSIDVIDSPTARILHRNLDSPTTAIAEPKMPKKQRKSLAVKSRMSEAKTWQLKKKKYGMMAWETWQDRKDKITELLKTPQYSPSTATDFGLVLLTPSDGSNLSEVSEPSKASNGSEFLKSQLLLDLMGENQDANMTDGFDFEVIDGVYVFRPTVVDFVDFEIFLKKVEEIAGREMGVVKVIVPHELLVSYIELADDVDRSMENDVKSGLKAFSSKDDTRISLNLTMLKPRITECRQEVIYDVSMIGGVKKPASEIVAKIGDFREALAKHFANNGEVYADDVDIFKDVGFAATCGEEDDMISKYGQIQSRDLYYGVSEVTEALRNTFQCDRILLNEFQSVESNRFVTSKEKVRKPMFHVTGLMGSTLGLQMTASAAYNFNVLHRGAPKCWTIIEPVDHIKVEEQFHPDSEKAGGRECRIHREEGSLTGSLTLSEKAEERLIDQSLGCRPCDLPPRCDQFMAHQPFYVPESALSSFEWKYRKVVQHCGEMIIIFPFAYYQVYATGNSLAEAIDYTNDRSDIFISDSLYHNCHHNCTGSRAKDNWIDYMANLEPVPIPTHRGQKQASRNSFPHAGSIFECDKAASIGQAEMAEGKSIWDHSI